MSLALGAGAAELRLGGVVARIVVLRVAVAPVRLSLGCVRRLTALGRVQRLLKCQLRGVGLRPRQLARFRRYCLLLL